MECPFCQSNDYAIFDQKIKLESFSGKLVLSTFSINFKKYIQEQKNWFSFFCKKCFKYTHIDLIGNKIKIKNENLFSKISSEWMSFDKLEILVPDVNFEKLVLDLDGTLITTMKKRDNYDQGEFEFSCDEDTYIGLKRPYLDEFKRYIDDRFSNVEIFTAAKELYAKEVLNLIGFQYNMRFQRDLSSQSPLMDSRCNFSKIIKNATVIEDNAFCVEGSNNIVLSIKSFIGGNRDRELLKLVDFFENHKSHYISI